MRAFDSALIAVLLITPIFLGSVFLLVDIPIFNPVSPFTLAIAVSGLCLGLLFGLFAGRWFTVEQFRVLAAKGAFKGLGSRRINVAVVAGLAVFLACSFLIVYFKATAWANFLVLFVISATFILSLTRLAMISSWERRERKMIMMEKNKVFAVPQFVP